MSVAAPVAVSGLIAAGMSASAASATVTFGLGATAAIGGAFTIIDTTNAVEARDWDRVAFNLGVVTGGSFVGGSGGGRYVANKVSPTPSSVPKGAGLFGDQNMHYQSGRGTLVDWFGTGPTPQSGGGAATAIASGTMTWLDYLSRGYYRVSTHQSIK